MYKKSNLTNIQHNIINFNLKRKQLIESISKKYKIMDIIDIPEIQIDKNNI